MRYLYLITTKGCQGCNIMRNILDEHFSNIRVIVGDYKHIPAWIETNVKATDFPTLVFIKDDVIKYHFSGTRSAGKIKEIIKTLGF